MSFSGGVNKCVYDTVKDRTEEISHTLISALQKSMENTWGFKGAGFRVQSHETGWANLTTHCQHVGVNTVVLPIFPLLPTPLACPPVLILGWLWCPSSHSFSPLH